ncbi:hypothetical protein SRIMM317S_06848 [Streptomyces rimosus subsp. rimosus]
MTRSATPSTSTTGMTSTNKAAADKAAADKTPTGKSEAAKATPRHDRIADAALSLLAERGLRGLTHRAVDEAAGLPQGSTSNLARTRAALLETAVRRLADREAAVLTPPEMPDAAGSGPAALADALSLGLHRSLTRHRDLTVARYELALEATRRPELRAIYDRTGQRFRRNAGGDADGGRVHRTRTARPERTRLVRRHALHLRRRTVPRDTADPAGTSHRYRGTARRPARPRLIRRQRPPGTITPAGPSQKGPRSAELAGVPYSRSGGPRGDDGRGRHRMCHRRPPPGPREPSAAPCGARPIRGAHRPRGDPVPAPRASGRAGVRPGRAALRTRRSPGLRRAAGEAAAAGVRAEGGRGRARARAGAYGTKRSPGSVTGGRRFGPPWRRSEDRHPAAPAPGLCALAREYGRWQGDDRPDEICRRVYGG